MAREVYLSSLTTGRCFKRAKEPSGEAEESGSPGHRVQRAVTMMTADKVFKIVGTEGVEVICEGVSGEMSRFNGSTLVLEVPRQGFDRLVERLRG